MDMQCRSDSWLELSEALKASASSARRSVTSVEPFAKALQLRTATPDFYTKVSGSGLIIYKQYPP